MNPLDCKHVTLANHPMLQVHYCTDCGCVTLHTGSISLRLDAASLEIVSRVLNQANGRLQEAIHSSNAARPS